MDDEPQQDQNAETPDESAAGPVADDAPSADAESPPSAPPAEDTAEDTASDTPAEGEQAEPEADEVSVEPAEQAPAEQAEVPAESVDAEGAGEAGEQSIPAEPSGSGKPGDLPPGADLDPIALEPQAELSAEERARLEAEEEERARREAELTGAAEPEPAASREPARMEAGARYLATGKRKSSIARATLTPGEGRIEVNERALEEYFSRPLHQTMARQPLSATGYEGNVDVRIRVHGGGISGQAGAVRHAIARALTEVDPELRGDLKRRGFLTRDARVKERRKAGLKKARKRPQFSKR
jgi:small subunit ribosomal protein S9